MYFIGKLVAGDFKRSRRNYIRKHMMAMTTHSLYAVSTLTKIIIYLILLDKFATKYHFAEEQVARKYNTCKNKVTYTCYSARIERLMPA